MKSKKEKHDTRRTAACRHRINILIAGLIFIAVGALILMKNLGMIEPGLYRMLLSWQMLLVVLGLWSICLRQIISGVVLAGVGAFFMIPLLAPVESGWAATYWPFIFILVGIVVLAHLLRPARTPGGFGEAVPHETEGFVDVNNSFGSVRHIVLDEVFKGACISTKFSGTILDLRRTTLAEGETFIDVEMRLSGLELIVPEGWTVVVDQTRMMMGGVEDKRYHTGSVDNSRKLVVRGSLSLSGIVIKS